MQTIVIGHRNPDMDSICSAVGYAEFKRLSGMQDVIAARAGATNERIDFVLEKFRVDPPVLINDLSPRVSDVMESRVVSVGRLTTVYDALQLIETKRLRGLPVVDEENRCLGLLSAFKLSHHLFPPREEAGAARLVTAALADIVSTIAGHVVVGNASEEPQDQLLMVAAMAQDSFGPRLQRYAGKQVILFVADRPHILDLAIKARLQAVVVTGGFQIPKDLQEAARKFGVTLISAPYDTATTVLLARGAVQVERVLLDEYTTFQSDTPLEEARRVAAESAGFVFPVVDDTGSLVGILSKSDFLKPVPRQLILVDHNELAQAVRGADRTPIIEILDHHKLGGFATNTPILFWNNPVGSTSTIVALCYQQAGIAIPPPIAGLLMAGLIADTLLLTSPTATGTDRLVLDHLAKIAGVDAPKLAEQIFSVGSPLLTMSPEQAIAADSKIYEQAGRRFSVGQIEELTFSHFDAKREELLTALEQSRQRENLYFSALLVTDINTQTSLLLVRGAPEFLATIDYPPHAPSIWELAGVVSRKKQLLPYLLNCLDRVTTK
jgi:manganese-dependent inorganic pyrophosphatase